MYPGAVHSSNFRSSRDQDMVPMESREDPGVARGYYELCHLVIQLLADGGRKRLEAELDRDEAQQMVDLLSQVLDDDESKLSQRERRYTLHSLVKFSKSKQIFPKSLEISNIQCDLSKHVREGGYGLVYQGSHEGKLVCVKAVRTLVGGADEGKLRAHAGELILWAHSSHSNILPFTGIYFSKESIPRVCIVSPWMKNGDLGEYMKANPNAPPEPLVHDVISGLKYLHDLDIVHNDLKAKNVIISPAGRAMLADFGISRVILTMETTTKEVGAGSTYWMAPELLTEDIPIPTFKSDIWAFACVCYEIITGMIPFHEHKVPPQLIMAFINKRVIPRKPNEGWNDAKEKIWSVAERCWTSDPDIRPGAADMQILVENLSISDHRPPEIEYRRPRNDVKVDYFRTFEVLQKIRKTLSPTQDGGLATTFEDQLVEQLIELQKHAGH